MLGLLLGLASTPVVAVVIGAIAALLGSLVLPQLPLRSGSGDPGAPPGLTDRRIHNEWRAGALGVACVVGVLSGIWMRTHDLLSPPRPTLKQQMVDWQTLGFSAEQARLLVVQAAGVNTQGVVSDVAVPFSVGAARRTDLEGSSRSVLFAERATRCAQLAPDRFATIESASAAYDAMGEKVLARVARGLGSRVPDGPERLSALIAVVEALCTTPSPPR